MTLRLSTTQLWWEYYISLWSAGEAASKIFKESCSIALQNSSHTWVFALATFLELLLLSACHRRSKGQSLFRFTFHLTAAALVTSADVWNIWYFLLFSLIVYSHPAVKVLLEKISLTEVSDRCSRRTLKIYMSTHNLGVLLSSSLRDTHMLEHGIRYRKPVKEVR